MTTSTDAVFYGLVLWSREGVTLSPEMLSQMRAARTSRARYGPRSYPEIPHREFFGVVRALRYDPLFTHVAALSLTGNSIDSSRLLMAQFSAPPGYAFETTRSAACPSSVKAMLEQLTHWVTP